MLPPNEVPVQDMPPKGGYKPINVYPTYAKKMIKGRHLFIGTALMTVWGMYMVGQANIAKRQRAQDKRERRMAILPFLQAEEDARYVHEHQKAVEIEAKIMKDVPNWIPGQSVYKTRDFMPPGDQRF